MVKATRHTPAVLHPLPPQLDILPQIRLIPLLGDPTCLQGANLRLQIAYLGFESQSALLVSVYIALELDDALVGSLTLLSQGLGDRGVGVSLFGQESIYSYVLR